MKKHIKHIVPILVAGSGFILTVRAGAATPSNSSFELPDPSLIGYYGTTPTLADQGGSGWSFYSEGNASAIGKPDTYWGVEASPDGGNFGVMQYASGIHQNVTPGAGLSTVSFYALANDDGTNIDISLGGTALKFGSGTPISIGNSSWTKYTSVVASVGAGNQTLLFGRNGAGYGNASSGTYIDGISYQHHIATANYNFESPASPGYYGAEVPTVAAQGGSGWTFDATGGNAGIGFAESYWNATGGVSPVGGQFAYLNYGGGMHQNVTLNGGPVTLSFYALANDDNTNIDIKLGSRALTFSRNPVSISNSEWALYTSDEITVGAGTYNLLFGRINNAGGGNASSGTYIDGVYLTQGAALPTYGSWSTANNVIGGPDQDSDNDGVLNGVEYFMNAAAGFTANPGLVNNTVTWPNGGNIPSSAYGSQFVVQTSANLVNWTDVPGTGDANLVNTSSSVTYTLTGSGTKFVRLKVTPN
jgi:hypothetical protein